MWVAHAPGMPVTFSRHRLQRKPLVSDPGMHHGTYVTHIPWCMSGSLTRGGGENVLSIPGACTTRNFTYLTRGPWSSVGWSRGSLSLGRWYTLIDTWYGLRLRLQFSALLHHKGIDLIWCIRGIVDFIGIIYTKIKSKWHWNDCREQAICSQHVSTYHFMKHMH